MANFKVVEKRALNKRPPLKQIPFSSRAGLAGLLLMQLEVLLGVFLLAGMLWCLGALLSWSVLDPSLSHAGGKAPLHNLMGAQGAIYADLSLQFLGFSSVAVFFPIFFWAIFLICQRPIPHLGRRIFLLICGVIFLSMALSFLPESKEEWPLPLGFGGVLGDALINLLQNILHRELNLFYKFIGFSVCLLLSVAALIRSSAINMYIDRPLRLEDAEFELLSGEEDASYQSEAFDKKSNKLQILSHVLLFPFKVLLLVGISSVRFLVRKIQNLEHPQNGESIEPIFEGVDAVAETGFENIKAINALSDFTLPTLARQKRTAARLESDEGEGERKRFDLPYLEYLSEPKAKTKNPELQEKNLQENAQKLESVLEDFGIKGKIIKIKPGPIVTLYEFEPAPGIKSSRVIGLADDIARSMTALSTRVAVVPGRNAIGIELPNRNRHVVYLREIMESESFNKSTAQLGLALGKTIGDEPVIADLAKMPHLLVAGTTGSGKSVAINTMILSLLYRLTPEQCRLIMVDPKMLELSVYEGIPHLLTPVVTDPKKAVVALKWAVREMEERYRKMAKLGVRNIQGFNERLRKSKKKSEALTRTIQTGFDAQTGEPVFETEQIDNKRMPYIVVIIDEMADLMMVAGKEIEGAVQRLAQMARAAGIHVIMATQRPSVDVITGTIKANFPTRISFSVTSKIDSRTILGQQGAEQLLGQGDMLFMMGGGKIQRVHGPFVDDSEVEEVVRHLKAQGRPVYLSSVTEDQEGDEEQIQGANREGGGEKNEIYDKAVDIVLHDRKVSTSYIQRRLGIGYNRAASIIEKMEQEGLISAANHVGKREILVPEQER